MPYFHRYGLISYPSSLVINSELISHLSFYQCSRDLKINGKGTEDLQQRTIRTHISRYDICTHRNRIQVFQKY